MAVRNTEASITAWAVALELVACRKLFGATESRDKPETHMLSPPYTNPYSTQIHTHTLSLSVYIYNINKCIGMYVYVYVLLMSLLVE